MEGNQTLDAALEYLEKGWAVIPINPDSKKPYVKWGSYVDDMYFPTEDDVINWWTNWPNW